MKKIILGLLIFTAFTTSCSSDDDNGLAVTEQNILGKWYLKGGKVNNGAFQNYIHECETLKDFQEFTSDGVITFNGYDSDCILHEVEGSNWTLDGNTLIVSSFDTDPFLFEDDDFITLYMVEDFGGHGGVRKVWCADAYRAFIISK